MGIDRDEMVVVVGGGLGVLGGWRLTRHGPSLLGTSALAPSGGGGRGGEKGSRGEERE